MKGDVMTISNTKSGEVTSEMKAKNRSWRISGQRVTHGRSTLAKQQSMLRMD